MKALTTMFLIAFHTITVLIFVVTVILTWYASITISRLRKTSATYNARLLPFAYYSLSSWILWVAQYSVLISGEFTASQSDILLRTALWLGVAQNALWAVAILSLYAKKLSRLSLTLPSLITLSLEIALASYRSKVLASELFTELEAVLCLIMFCAFARSIMNLRLRPRLTPTQELQTGKHQNGEADQDSATRTSRVFAKLFFIDGKQSTPTSEVLATIFLVHGLSQCLWRVIFFTPSHTTRLITLLLFPLTRIALLVSWTKMISILLKTAQSSYEKVVSEIKKIELSPTPLPPFLVMISSTMEDLLQERDATEKAVRSLHLERFRAETFGSRSDTPRRVCEQMARQCDLFILIVGPRYGHVIEEGISVVEFEYNVAHAQNREKILVYVKDGVNRERRQQEFFEKVQNFDFGHLRSIFSTPEALYERIHEDVVQWLASHAKQQLLPGD